MRKLLLVCGLMLTGCAEATTPDVIVVTVRCTLVQLPDGTILDRCLRE